MQWVQEKSNWTNLESGRSDLALGGVSGGSKKSLDLAYIPM